ncbi:MAG: hypothetical protein AAGI68_05315 [Planctomycetota bacterium]
MTRYAYLLLTLLAIAAVDSARPTLSEPIKKAALGVSKHAIPI